MNMTLCSPGLTTAERFVIGPDRVIHTLSGEGGHCDLDVHINIRPDGMLALALCKSGEDDDAGAVIVEGGAEAFFRLAAALSMACAMVEQDEDEGGAEAAGE